jgi:iron complex transport system ATP-binding protein
MRLTVENLSVRYGERVALSNVSFTARPGALVGLIGPNGAGKSTLMRALAGLLPHAGKAAWNERPLEALDARERARTLAYLPQAATVHWPIKVRDLVALGRLPHRAFAAPLTTQDLVAIEEAMREADVEAFAERSVAELSMGERARVLLARALAVRAPILLVDEPIAMLDPYHELQIMQMLSSYARGGRLVLAVLHEVSLAGRYCDRLLLIDRGALAADGPPATVLAPSMLRAHYHVEPWHPDDGCVPVVPWRLVD